MTRRALVIGGSLGGLLAAHLLVGLGTHPQLIAALRRAGVAFSREPAREDWGGWVATFADPDGNEFCIGRSAAERAAIPG